MCLSILGLLRAAYKFVRISAELKIFLPRFRAAQLMNYTWPILLNDNEVLLRATLGTELPSIH